MTHYTVYLKPTLTTERKMDCGSKIEGKSVRKLLTHIHVRNSVDQPKIITIGQTKEYQKRYYKVKSGTFDTRMDGEGERKNNSQTFFAKEERVNARVNNKY